MANSMLKTYRVIAMALVLALAAPVATLAKDGKKHFKEGQKYEANQQWDKAAEKFALAVAEKPSDIQYRLHLQRSLVNAAVMLVERGNKLAEQKDYNAAYIAYRQAYAFDPTNELSLIKARRMLEAQGLPTKDLPAYNDPAGPKYKPDTNGKTQTAKYITGPDGSMFVPPTMKVQMPSIPGKRFVKTDIDYRDTPLLTVLEQLGHQMKLNIMVDQQAQNMMRNMKVTVNLRDVTHPRALEMLLKTHNLMYAQLDSRTIVVASDNPASRQRYEPFAVRTFYVKNADITDVKTAIQGAIPQAKQITTLKQLNALIARDTPANLELIEAMINSVDKAKAEVLVDINIYEVSRNDLLQLGNQFNIPGEAGQRNSLNLGFIGGIEQERNVIAGGPARMLTGPLGFALGLPPSLISFFQDKGKSKLLASTQVHVLDDQDQSIRIGQRVPIQTAFIPTFNSGVTTPNANPNQGQNLNTGTFTQGVNPFGSLGTSGFPSFQYENVGLNIDMKPRVFEDEVELKMKIESSSLDRSTGDFTPSFNQRTMSSMARVKDGQTTLIAGVSQTEETKVVKGIPLIGLIPILGRFFSTPSTADRQSDVIITVTPHILRRADIREEDHLAKAAGDATTSTTQLRIEQILYLADYEDTQQNQVAGNPLPGANATETKPAMNTQTQPANLRPEASSGVVVGPVPTTTVAQPPSQPRSNVTRETVDRPGAPVRNPANEDDEEDDDDEEATAENQQQTAPVTVSVRSAQATAIKGQDLYVAMILNGDALISGAHISLTYDANVLEVKGVRDSGLLRMGGANPELQFTAEAGQLNIEIQRPQGTTGVTARGQLVLVQFTVKGPGQSPLTLIEGQTLLRGVTGQPIDVRLQSSQIEAR